MHVEIDRVATRTTSGRIEASLQRVLRDVRESVEDWPRMRDRALGGRRRARRRPAAAVRGARCAHGVELLRWLADDHFTFLGYREYLLEEDGDDLALRAVPGTGLGILRADQRHVRVLRQAARPRAAKAREKTLLVLAKANSRATVHRPAYLDYIGRQDVRRAGEVVGERRFLGLFSSAAYTESVTPDPAAAREGPRRCSTRSASTPAATRARP